MNILVLTNVLPAPVLGWKKQENDVLLTTADFHESLQPDVKYTFVYVVSYSNFLLSWFSERWREFYQFRLLGKYEIRGREVTIIPVPNFLEDGPFKALFIRIGYFMNRRKLQHLLRRHQIDLVHAHDIKLNAGIAYYLFKESGIPYVITSRKLGKLKMSETLSRYFKAAKAIINLGFSQQELAVQQHKHSYVIPHGIDSRFLQQEKSYPQEPNTLRIVSLCRLLGWKNIDQVLLALEQLDADFVYDIYGEGPDQERLSSLLATLKIRDQVSFKGHLPYQQVPGTLASYDLFVLPSYREMFGRVYIEAMSCGLPVIGAKGCGIDGYIKDGVEGFLVNHRNIDEIAAAIKKFVRDPALKETMGKNARTLSADFSWERIIKKIDAVYRQSLQLSESNSGDDAAKPGIQSTNNY